MNPSETAGQDHSRRGRRGNDPASPPLIQAFQVLTIVLAAPGISGAIATLEAKIGCRVGAV